MAVTPAGPDAAGPASAAAGVAPTRAPFPPGALAGPDRAELATATGAVVAVSVALGRYVLEQPVRRTGAVLRRVGSAPVRRESAVLRRGTAGLLARAVGRLAGRVGEMAGEVADVVVPAVAREVLARLDLTAIVLEHVDVDRVAATLDVDAVVARVDVDAVVDRADLDAVVRRIDVDAIAAGLDLDALVGKVDIAAVLDRVDLDEVVARVDLDRAVRRVDVAGVIDRVDLDEVVARVDLDRAVERVDLDRILERADIVGIARYVVEQLDLPDLIRYSSGSVSAEMVRGVRDQSADADRAVERVVDRLLHRHGRRAAEVPVQPRERGSGPAESRP